MKLFTVAPQGDALLGDAGYFIFLAPDLSSLAEDRGFGSPHLIYGLNNEAIHALPDIRGKFYRFQPPLPVSVGQVIGLHLAIQDWNRSRKKIGAATPEVVGKKFPLKLRNEIKGIAAAGYEHMRLKLPDRVLRIEKIGSEEGVVAQNLGEISKTTEKISISKI